MMQFFRKYQRFFLVVLSVMIITSFSFFGTYSTLTQSETKDPIAFVDASGEKVPRSYLDAFVRFIATDVEDKMLYGGMWGPNFLNDGIIRHDLFESGFQKAISEPFFNELIKDLAPRLEREKLYHPYIHPNNNQISAKGAWAYFAPTLLKKLQVIQTMQEISPEFLALQADLYREESSFPAPYLRQVLAYQEMGEQNVIRDPALERSDLSLFGYHTIEDWFGPRFLQLAAETIINGSAVAKQRGLAIADSEVLADLLFNCERSYRQMERSENPYLTVRGSGEYFQEQLRILGMDQGMAIKIWKQVMLFRKLANETPLFVDPLTYETFNQFAKEAVEVEMVQLPKALNFSDEKSLRKFELYLQLAAKPKLDPFDVPQEMKSAEEVAPELVQRRYTVEASKVTRQELALRPTIKEVWAWELEDKNWLALMLRFPELGTESMDRASREKTLDALDDHLRLAVDLFARSSMVQDHLEWVDEALEGKKTQRLSFGIRAKGANEIPFFAGADMKALQPLLDTAEEAISRWSCDGETYFRIRLIDRDVEPQILTFEEACQDKTLDNLLKESTSNSLCDLLIEETAAAGFPWLEESGISRGDYAAHVRFFPYTMRVRDAYLQDRLTPLVVLQDSDLLEEAFEKKNAILQNQFKWRRQTKIITRSDGGFFDPQTFFTLEEMSVAPVALDANLGPYFFQMLAKLPHEVDYTLIDKGQKQLQDAAKEAFVQSFVANLVDKGALTIAYCSDGIE